MGTEHGSGESLRRATSDEVEIVDVELRDGSGRPASMFRSGEPMQVVVALRSPRAAALALELRSQEGVRLFHTAHADIR